MLKKIIKTHAAKWDFVDIIKSTFLRNAVTTNHQRRVIASLKNKEKNMKYKKSKYPLNIPHSYWISFAPDTRIRLASIFFAPYWMLPAPSRY